MMKKRSRLVMAALMVVLLICTLSSTAVAEKKIGIIIWETEKNYTDAKEGLMAQLDKEGFGEPKASYVIEDAGGSKVRAADIAKKFSTEKLDLIVAIGTSAAVAVFKETKDVPLVFTVVYDPVDSKIATDWKSSGNNTTGTSSKIHMSLLLENLKLVAPAKNLAVLYTPGEKNSEAQLKDLQSAQAQFGIRIIPVPLTTREETPQIVADVMGRAEAVFLSGSSIAIDALPTIVETAKKAGVITTSIQSDKVEKGILLGVYANTRTLGTMAGEKAAKVLKGAKPSSISIDTVKKPDIIVNMKTAKDSRINVPTAFLKTATRVIE
jgi:putative ABC transport system substrate-binding protein